MFVGLSLYRLQCFSRQCAMSSVDITLRTFTENRTTRLLLLLLLLLVVVVVVVVVIVVVAAAQLGPFYSYFCIKIKN
jgi:hypothetical protein